MNTGLHLRTDYWSDPVAKAAFCDLALDVFGLDFSAWTAAGFWDDKYRPFTWFDPDGRAVSSVCLYEMTLVVDGVVQHVGQVSGVATRPEWRRRGLARGLMGEALVWSAQSGHAFQYLFADDDAVPLYRGLGFVPVREYTTTIEIAGSDPVPGARQLDVDDPADLNLIHGHALSRQPASRRLGTLSDKLVMFHVLGPLRGAAWFVEPFGVVVLARRRDAVLTVFDVIGREVPALADLYPFLADPGDSRLVLRFETDRLGDLTRLGRVGVAGLSGNNLQVRGAFPLTEPVVFPLTAQA